MNAQFNFSKDKTMTELQKMGDDLRGKRGRLAELAAKARETEGNDSAVLSDLKALNAEVNELAVKYDALAEAASIELANDRAMKNMNIPATSTAQNGGNTPTEFKSLGEMFTSSEQFKGYKPTGSNNATAEIEGVSLKTLMTTLNGWEPEVTRTGKTVDLAQQRPTIASLMPSTNTTQSAIEYMEEVVYDNQTAFVAEGNALPESGLSWLPREYSVKEVGTFLPVTKRQLEDVPQVISVINNRLVLMLQQREDAALLNGVGGALEIQGIRTNPLVMVQALGADSRIDAISKSMERVETSNFAATGAATVSAIIMHPTRWGEISRMKDTTDRYLIGDPVNGASGARLWGAPVITTTAMLPTEALVGDFRMYSEIFRRTGISIEAGYINDQFIKGQQSIKITERIALAIYRATAFCRITGF
jgi:HK97 family phage major capsid protein